MEGAEQDERELRRLSLMSALEQQRSVTAATMASSQKFLKRAEEDAARRQRLKQERANQSALWAEVEMLRKRNKVLHEALSQTARTCETLVECVHDELGEFAAVDTSLGHSGASGAASLLDGRVLDNMFDGRRRHSTPTGAGQHREGPEEIGAEAARVRRGLAMQVHDADAAAQTVRAAAAEMRALRGEYLAASARGRDAGPQPEVERLTSLLRAAQDELVLSAQRHREELRGRQEELRRFEKAYAQAVQACNTAQGLLQEERDACYADGVRAALAETEKWGLLVPEDAVVNMLQAARPSAAVSPSLGGVGAGASAGTPPVEESRLEREVRVLREELAVEVSCREGAVQEAELLGKEVAMLRRRAVEERDGRGSSSLAPSPLSERGSHSPAPALLRVDLDRSRGEEAVAMLNGSGEAHGLNPQLAGLRAERNTGTDAVREEELARVRLELAGARAEREEGEAARRVAEDELKRVRAELWNVRAERSEGEELVRVRSELAGVQAERDEGAAARRRAEGELRRVKSELADVRAERDEGDLVRNRAEGELRRVRSELAGVQAERDEGDAGRRRTEEELRRVKLELIGVRGERDELEVGRSKADAELRRVKAELTDVRKERDEGEEVRRKAETELRRVRSQLADARADRDDEDGSTRQHEELRRINAELSEAKAEREEVDRGRQVSEEGLKRAKSELAEAKAARDSAEEGQRLLDEELKRVRVELSEAQAERDRLEEAARRQSGEQLTRVKVELSEARAERDRLEEGSKGQLEGELERVKSELEEARAERDRLEEEIRRQSGEELARVKVELSEAQAERDRLEEGARRQLEEVLTRVKVELSECVMQRESAETAKAQAEEALARVELELAGVNAEWDAANGAKGQLEGELRCVKAELSDVMTERDRAQEAKRQADDELRRIMLEHAEALLARNEAASAGRVAGDALEDVARADRASADAAVREAREELARVRWELEKAEGAAWDAQEELGRVSAQLSDAVGRRKEAVEVCDELIGELKVLSEELVRVSARVQNAGAGAAGGGGSGAGEADVDALALCDSVIPELRAIAAAFEAFKGVATRDDSSAAGGLGGGGVAKAIEGGAQVVRGGSWVVVDSDVLGLCDNVVCELGGIAKAFKRVEESREGAVRLCDSAVGELTEVAWALQKHQESRDFALSVCESVISELKLVAGELMFQAVAVQRPPPSAQNTPRGAAEGVQRRGSSTAEGGGGKVGGGARVLKSLRRASLTVLTFSRPQSSAGGAVQELQRGHFIHETEEQRLAAVRSCDNLLLELKGMSGELLVGAASRARAEALAQGMAEELEAIGRGIAEFLDYGDDFSAPSPSPKNQRSARRPLQRTNMGSPIGALLCASRTFSPAPSPAVRALNVSFESNKTATPPRPMVRRNSSLSSHSEISVPGRMFRSMNSSSRDLALEVGIINVEKGLEALESAVEQAFWMSCDVPGLRRKRQYAIDAKIRIELLEDELDGMRLKYHDALVGLDSYKDQIARQQAEGFVTAPATPSGASMGSITGFFRLATSSGGSSSSTPTGASFDGASTGSRIPALGFVSYAARRRGSKWFGLLPRMRFRNIKELPPDQFTRGIVQKAADRLLAARGKDPTPKPSNYVMYGETSKPIVSDGDANSANAQQALLVMREGTIWNAVSFIHTDEGRRSWEVCKHDMGSNKDWVMGRARGVMGETPLHLAVLFNNSPQHDMVMCELWDKCPRLRTAVYLEPLYRGENVLHIAIVRKLNFSVIRKFVESPEGPTLLSQAATGLFFKDPTMSDGCCAYGEYPLCFAACTNQKDVFDYLVSKGAPLTVRTSEGRNLLHLLVLHSVHKATDQNFEDAAEASDKEDAFRWCMDMYDHVKDHMVQKGIYNEMARQLDDNKHTPLTLAAAKGSLSMFFHLLSMYMTVEWTFGPVTCRKLVLDFVDIPLSREQNRKSVLDVVVDMQRYDILEAGQLKKVLDAKWEKYARSMFLHKFSSAIAFTVALMMTSTINGQISFIHKAVLLAAELVCIVMYLGSCLKALQGIARAGFTKFVVVHDSVQTERVFQLVTPPLCLLLFSLRWWRELSFTGEGICRDHAASPSTTPYVERWLLGLQSGMAFANVFIGLMGFQEYGQFVLMLVQMMRVDVRKFTVIYAIFLFGAAQVMLIASDRLNTGVRSYIDCLRMAFEALLQQVDFDAMHHRSEMVLLGISIVNFFFVSLVLINLLIAMMSSTYEEIKQGARQRWSLVRASIIRSLDAELSDDERLSERTKFWEWENKTDKTGSRFMTFTTSENRESYLVDSVVARDDWDEKDLYLPDTTFQFD